MDRDKVHDPWRDETCLPTLVGSMKLLLRTRHPNGHVTVRLAEAFEYARGIGWEDEMWVKYEEGAFASPGSGFAFIELVANMAGNAWSALQYAAVHTALVATAGKFCGVQDTGDAGSGGGSAQPLDFSPTECSTSGSSY